MTTSLVVLAALAVDALFGEPRRCHPLVGFGRLAQTLERSIYGNSVWRGLAGLVLLIAPFALLALGTRWLRRGVVFNGLLLYLAIGWNSLNQHAVGVRDALLANDRPAARERVGRLVSRDTATLDNEAIARAAVESILENGNDAVFGAIFWFVVAGAPGIVVYRLTNTLDAMWGYRNGRYRRFGRTAARLDDIMNFLPARLTALSYAVVGDWNAALRCWRSQGRAWKSRNAGPVMAAGAGSLGVTLGGPASYHGTGERRGRLGEGPEPRGGDIARAQRLIGRALLLWLLLLAIGGWFVG